MSEKLIDFIENSPAMIKQAAEDALKDVQENKKRPYVLPVDPATAFVNGFCLGDGINVVAKRYLFDLVRRLSDDDRTRSQRETDRKEAHLLVSRMESEKAAQDGKTTSN